MALGCPTVCRGSRRSLSTTRLLATENLVPERVSDNFLVFFFLFGPCAKEGLGRHSSGRQQRLMKLTGSVSQENRGPSEFFSLLSSNLVSTLYLLADVMYIHSFSDDE